jgi:outer membrane cobalamin receptor
MDSRSRVLVLLATGPLLLAADAGAEPPKPKVEAGATVTVTAEAAPVEVAKTPNPVKVLDKIAIEQSGAKTLGELLSDLLPGQILSNGGVGTAATTLLGGTRNQDVVVTLDGIRLTDASGLGGSNANTLALAGIERIEVQSGPCSSRFGAEAMGGVIALYSAGTAAKGLSGEVAETVGTQGIAGLRSAAAYGWERGWVRAAFQGQREDQATDTPKPFRATGGFLGLGQELGQDSLLTLSYRNAYTGTPIPYATVAPTTRIYAPDRESRSRNEQIVGSLRTVYGTDWMTEFTLGHVIQSRQEPGYPAGFTDYGSRRNQALGRVTWTPIASLRTSLGADAYEETARTPGYPAGIDEGKGRHVALDFESSWEPLDRLRVVGALRQQWDRQNFVGTGSMPAPAEASSDHITWKLGVNALLGGGFRLYASGGTAFSLPFLSAVMYNATSGGSEPLNREESKYLTTGATWEQGPWSAKLEGSRTLFRHLVYFDLNSYLYANGSNMRTQGLEASGGYRVSRWGLEGFYRNQEARDLSQPKDAQLSAPAVVRRPFNSFGLKAFTVLGAFRLDGRWGWFGPHYENFGGFPAMLGASKVHFNDLALGAAWAATPAFTLTLRGEHLLQPRVTVEDWKNRTQDGRNDAYQIYGFPAQPRTFSLEARYRF